MYKNITQNELYFILFSKDCIVYINSTFFSPDFSSPIT